MVSEKLFHAQGIFKENIEKYHREFIKSLTNRHLVNGPIGVLGIDAQFLVEQGSLNDGDSVKVSII